MSEQVYDKADWLNDKEYAALLNLYHDYHAAFQALPEYMQQAYYIRLYSYTRLYSLGAAS